MAPSHVYWGQDLAPDYRQQAQLEVDYGGPIISLEQQDAPQSLNMPVASRNASLQSQVGHRAQRMQDCLQQGTDEQERDFANMIFNFDQHNGWAAAELLIAETLIE